MKKIIVFVVIAIVIASCGGGEFGTVGKKFDKEKDIDKLVKGNYKSGYFKGENGKTGCVLEEKIAVPAVFDDIKGVNPDKDGKALFIVEKNGKKGLVKAFDKAYLVPCEYEKVDANAAKNLLYLQKPGEAMETYSLDTGKKWDGTDKWPPKKFPADVPFKVLSDMGSWQVESITCTGRSEQPGAFAFKVKGTGLKNSQSRSFHFYPEEEGTNQVNQSLGSAYFFPDVKQGEPFEFDFVGVWDAYFQDVRFAGFLIRN